MCVMRTVLVLSALILSATAEETAVEPAALAGKWQCKVETVITDLAFKGNAMLVRQRKVAANGQETEIGLDRGRFVISGQTLTLTPIDADRQPKTPRAFTVISVNAETLVMGWDAPAGTKMTFTKPPPDEE